MRTPPAQISLPQSAPTVSASARDVYEVVAPVEPETERGTTEYFGGSAVPTQRETSQSGLAEDRRHGVELNFVDADIRRVVDAILGDMLHSNYTVDEAVKGSLTLRTGRPIARSSVLPALEAALSTVDAALINQNGVIRVVPLAKARDLAMTRRPLSARDRTVPGFAVEILPVRYTSVHELEKLLSAVARKEAILQVDEARNQLIIAGSTQERAAIRATIERFDVDWMRGTSFALYKLDSVEPGALTSELQAILKPPLDLLSRVRLVPLPRLKSVLGIANKRADLAQLETWIKRLDHGQGSSTRSLYIYNVQNGRARDLAQSLQLVLGGGNYSGGGNTNEGFSSASSNSIRTTGETAAAGNQLLQSSQNGNSSGSGFTSTQTTNQINPTQSGSSGFNVGSGDQPRIVPDEPNNALLIFGTRVEYDLILDALKKLDTLPRQVLIEAILAEVTLTNDLQYGIQWSFNDSNVTITQSTANNGSVASSFPGFSVLYTGSSDIRAVLNALQSKANVKVLSSPKLMVLNNQTATLQVGDQVPIITQQAQGVTSPGAPIVNTVELRDTGVILKVTPRVNDSGLVILDIAQEVSDVAATTTSGINSPTIQQRRLSSTIAAQSGTTVALGGLIRDSVSRGKSGMPFLSQIPLLGSVFGKNTNQGRRTELLILLTPTEDMRSTVNDLIDRMDLVEPLVRRAVKDQVKTSVEPEIEPKPVQP
jgi:general secretion pathway protein D